MSKAALQEAATRLRAHGFDVHVVRTAISGTLACEDDEEMSLPDGRRLIARRNAFAVYRREGQWELSVTKGRSPPIPDLRHLTLEAAVDELLRLFKR